LATAFRQFLGLAHHHAEGILANLSLLRRRLEGAWAVSLFSNKPLWRELETVNLLYLTVPYLATGCVPARKAECLNV
jgi:hypothetical protein